MNKSRSLVINYLDAKGLIKGDEPRHYLTRYLGSIASGKPVYLRDRNFYNFLSREELFSLFSYEFSGKMKTLPKDLIDLESKEITQFNYFSRVLPFSERRNTLLPFFVDKPKFSPDLRIFREAVKLTKKKFPSKRLRPSSLELVVTESKKNTQWGLPFCTSGKVGADLYYKEAKSFLATNSIVKYPYILGTRTQPSGDPEHPKQRVVWMASHSISLLESTMVTPLVNHVKNLPYYSALNSFGAVDFVITDIMNNASSSGLPILSIDFTQFDSRNSRELILNAFDIVFDCFQEGSIDRVLFDQLVDHFITADLVTPEKIYTGRDSGVPSGSGFTNLIDSICHTIIFHYVALRMGYLYSDQPNHFCCNGDDGVWLIPGITPELAELIVGELGHFSNKDKQGFGNYVIFCQRLHTPDVVRDGIFVGIRSLVRTLTRMVFIERFQDRNIYNDGILSLRIMAQLEECYNNPLYSDFLYFCMRGDPLQFGLKLPDGLTGLFKLAGTGYYDVLSRDSWTFSNQYSGGRAYSLKTFRKVNEIIKSGYNFS